MEKGDKVEIMNQDFSGNPIIEGTATLIKLISKDSYKERWLVHFPEDALSENYERNILINQGA